MTKSDKAPIMLFMQTIPEFKPVEVVLPGS